MSTHFTMFGASITAISEAVTTATSRKDDIHAALEGLATNNTSQGWVRAVHASMLVFADETRARSIREPP
jgi:hypothetical protein